ncbi:major facilitator superfamily transporter [Labilithrix luteola]|uniref:Major facilitator superfamily transporter n=1 Tax=Labilithrix luteola TaxID=1391654 RepID=A0A0K1PNX3_9BACT|nr:MFS transporter [Labilithrix luteola]AKU95202.1 major facilitator superfamily transporter [Labilithrix luteola]
MSLEKPKRSNDGLKNSAAILAVAFAGFSTFLDLYATQPLLPRFTEIFHASKAEVGLTVSAPTAAVALCAPIFGAIGDRFSRTRLMIASLAFLSLTTLLAATSTGLGSLIVWRFLQGAATPGVYVLALAYLAEEIDVSLVGRAMAAFVTGNVIGGWAGRSITGWIAQHTHWPFAFIVLGLLNGIGAFVTWKFLPPSRVRGGGATPLPLGRRIVGLATPALLANFAIGFNVLFSLVAVFSYVGFYLTASPFKLATGSLSTIYAVYLVGAFVTPIAGRFIDRVGSRRVLVGSLGIGALGLMLTLIPFLPAVVAGLAVCCSSAFVCQSASTTRLRSAAPPGLRSLASGAYVTCYYLGGSVGGIAPGLTWKYGGWAGCVALVVIVELMTMGLATYFWSEARTAKLDASA